MTIFVDNFHTVRASISLGQEVGLGFVSIMVATDAAELHRFARKIGAYEAWFRERSSFYVLPVELQRKAILLGAVAVDYPTLAAMLSLRHLGEDMEPADTARGRLGAIARIAARVNAA